jgi:chromosomal replication initiation ATPase DnaA|tara:strand:- start:3800 stop:4105 length:306 start_codon:yes stop_codon:yes gene_type:complete
MKKDIFDKYASAVADKFHVNLDSIFEKSKRRHLVDARQMLYLLCKERPISVAYIQHYLAEHGYEVAHTTIMYNYKKAKEQVKSDPEFKQIYKILSADESLI